MQYKKEWSDFTFLVLLTFKMTLKLKFDLIRPT